MAVKLDMTALFAKQCSHCTFNLSASSKSCICIQVTVQHSMTNLLMPKDYGWNSQKIMLDLYSKIWPDAVGGLYSVLSNSTRTKQQYQINMKQNLTDFKHWGKAYWTLVRPTMCSEQGDLECQFAKKMNYCRDLKLQPVILLKTQRFYLQQ